MYARKKYKMIMNTKIIDDALFYYGIHDKTYMDKCHCVIKQISSNPKSLCDFENIYSILYIDKSNKIESLWKYKDIKELFKIDIPFITNIMLLLGYEFHSANMSKLNFDEEQIIIHKTRVRECLTNDIYNRNATSIRISQLMWGSYFINCRLIEIGRLQYELWNHNIKIHIPGGGKLLFHEVQQSLIDSEYYIHKYFQIKNYQYYCNSWLLSPNLKELLDQNSNIIKFQSLFSIQPGESCVDDILNFVFNDSNCHDFNQLKENTNLQKRLKQFLLCGNDIKIGVGILNIEEVK